MNDEIRGTLSRALPEDLPAARIDLDDVELKGEKLIRRRRIGVAGLTAVGAAVFAAAVAVPLVVLGPGGDGLAGNGRDGYELPELDPDTDYDWSWGGDDAETEATKELSQGFWEQLSTGYPDLKVPDLTDGWPEGWNAQNLDYLEPEDYPDAVRAELTLSEVKPGTGWPDSGGSDDLIPTDYTKPMYTTDGTFVALLNEDARFFDSFNFTVHPKGSFAEGPKSVPGASGATTAVPHLAPGCEDQTEKKFGFEYECEETTGPDGEKVWQIEMTHTGGSDAPDTVLGRENTVIVTLTNGNAVVISVEADGHVDGEKVDEGTDADELRPTLSCEELTELVLALPQVAVE